jgi:capsular exopolysaccharide synthesis family protein
MTSGKLAESVAELVQGNITELMTLGGNLHNVARGRELHTILVTSSHPGEGKTTTAISVAQTLADHVHSRVALLDANFYAPKLHELYHLEPTPGLSDILIHEREPRQVLQPTQDPNLTILSAGTPLQQCIGRHEVAMLQKTMQTLQNDFNYIVVDGCHYFQYSDVALYASLFDGIIFVIECEKTNWEVVQQAKEGLENVGGQMLGAVLNKRRYYIPGKLYGRI